MADIKRLCQEAVEHNFYAVCVPPYFVSKVEQELQNSSVKIATVIGFPYGYSETPIKVAEARRCIEEGADELDIVINISAVKSGDWNYVRTEIEQMATTVRLKGKICKLILELSVLSTKKPCGSSRSVIRCVLTSLKPTQAPRVVLRWTKFAFYGLT